jgi:hypothetical protein
MSRSEPQDEPRYCFRVKATVQADLEIGGDQSRRCDINTGWKAKSGDQIFGSGTYMGWNGQQSEYGQLQLEGAKTPAAASIPIVGLEQERHGSRHSIPKAH